jgi:glucose-1-phosphate adenylyltransferase
MPRIRVLAIIQAGGAGGRMEVLTAERAKPALPFAGSYQLIDFPLSNLANSGISDVWLSLQYLSATLEEQVANGRPWDLDRTHGGLRLLMPQQGTGTAEEEGFARGNADVLYRIRQQIKTADPEMVLVLSSDHVYRFDYSAAIATHLREGAECTIVTTEVALEQASQHATVESDAHGLVTGFEYKPDSPSSSTVATEIFVYDPDALIEVLQELHSEHSGQAEHGDTGLGDFGETLVPRFVERKGTYAHPLPGYWRDLGQPHLYLAAHRDVLTDDQGLFDDQLWPIRTRQPQRVAARVLAGSLVEDSLLSSGVRVYGTVRRSVLGPGVVVEEGASVCDSVVYADVTVAAGATIDWSIVDVGSSIGPGAQVGSPDAEGVDDPSQVTLVGKEVTISEGAVVARGARLEPRSSV